MARATEKTRKLVQMAILIAVMLILAFTPLGYLKVGAIEITFMTIPVVVGAIILGPAAGAVLGGVFGLTSFIQCFGMSAFGAALLNISPILTFLVCMVPRILMGYLAGVIFGRCIIAAGQNSVLCRIFLIRRSTEHHLFVSLVMLLFGSSDYITEMRGGLGLLSFLAAFVGFQWPGGSHRRFCFGYRYQQGAGTVPAKRIKTGNWTGGTDEPVPPILLLGEIKWTFCLKIATLLIFICFAALPAAPVFHKNSFSAFPSSEWLSVRWLCFIAWYFSQEAGDLTVSPAVSFLLCLALFFLSQPHSADCLSQYPKAPWRHNSRNGCAIFQRRNLHG